MLFESVDDGMSRLLNASKWYKMRCRGKDRSRNLAKSLDVDKRLLVESLRLPDITPAPELASEPIKFGGSDENGLAPCV